MALKIKRLSDRKVQTIKKPGRYADGGGLYLIVDPSGAKRWVFMSWRGGRQIELGLGGLTSVSLKAARAKAAACSTLAAEGRDPREALKPNRGVPTFGELADEVIAKRESSWTNATHRRQWRVTLATYAAPLLSKPVDQITTDDVMKVLQPIWSVKEETASRVRGRIETILDAAKFKGYRDGENPARWRGHLEHWFKRGPARKRQHHAAMPWREVSEFIGRLRAIDSISARCLEFVILNADRSGEVLGSIRGGEITGARWDEIDLDAKVWTIPAVRMKGGVEHRVPLSSRALAILEEMAKLGKNDFIFPGQRGGRPLSCNVLLTLMRRMGVERWTVHGFRSSFRDWAAEHMNVPYEIAEQALAHKIGSKVSRAYHRGDALEKRRELMQAWCNFCEPETVINVVPLRSTA
jgi:integrase